MDSTSAAWRADDPRGRKSKLLALTRTCAEADRRQQRLILAIGLVVSLLALAGLTVGTDAPPGPAPTGD